WDDGTTDTLNLAAGVLEFTKTHTYLNNKPLDAPFNIGVTVTDKDGASVSGTRVQRVDNVTPNITAITPNTTQIFEGQSISVRVAFTDPGPLDTFTALVVWGDGTQETFAVGQGQREFTRTHTYVQASCTQYVIGVRVTDEDNASDAKAFGTGAFAPGNGVRVLDLV